MSERPSIDELVDLVSDERWDAVQPHMPDYHPKDLAELIRKVPAQHHARLFSIVVEDAKPDVLAELESDSAGRDILESLSDTELSHLVEDMAPDDAADIIADLPDDRSEQVLDLMQEDESRDVRKLLEYEEDTAGGIMTTDVVSMRKDQTVSEALDAIAYLDTREKFYNANIVDAHGRLIGYIEVWDLLRERDRNRSLGQLLHEHVTSVTVDMDQEEVAQLMRKYDLTVLPVVDAEGTLVGRITSDDVIDVIDEEASEDIFRLAGSDDIELEIDSALKSCLVRLPWLLITLVGGFVTSVILGRFHAHVAGMLVLAAFVPVVLAMGGNTGVQSSTLVVRSLAFGKLNRKQIGRLLLKELIAGALMGCICGLLTGTWAVLLVAFGDESAITIAPHQLAATVSIALFASMTFATLFGASVPILLDQLKVDPALASGPFVIIANDIAALLIFFGVTILLAYQAPGI